MQFILWDYYNIHSKNKETNISNIIYTYGCGYEDP